MKRITEKQERELICALANAVLIVFILSMGMLIGASKGTVFVPEALRLSLVFAALGFGFLVYYSRRMKGDEN